MSNYPGIDFLNQQPPWDGVSILGTEAPFRTLRLLGNPQNQVNAIHVTGTNGKGTTCATIAAILIAAGYRVGQHSSPHLSEVTERCLIQGTPVEAEEYDRAICKVCETIATEGFKLTFFELSTIAAFVVFAERKLDWMVIEVGLGGRWDATNVMARPRATVLTSVALDHVRLLGDTTAKIATEKVQIFRPDVPAIVGEIDRSVRDVVVRKGREVGAPVIFAGEDFELEGSSLNFRGAKVSLPLAEAGLIAKHQVRNVTLASVVALTLGLDPSAVWRGVCQARWPGRLEGFTAKNSSDRSVAIITDGAHNPDGVRAFLDYLGALVRQIRSSGSCRSGWARGLVDVQRIIFVVAILNSKDVDSMLECLDNSAKELIETEKIRVEWIFTESGHHLSIQAEALQQQFGQGRGIKESEEALRVAVESADDSALVVITGSLYLLGKLRSSFTSEAFRTFADECD